MTNKQSAWIHPQLGGWVVLPDGFQMGKDEARANGFAIEAWPAEQKVATPHPYDKTTLITPRGLGLSPELAAKIGFEVRAALPEAQATADPSKAWRAAIYRMPEANARPAAAAEIVKNYSPATMSIDQVQAFLRGLPVEAAPTKAVAPAPVDAKAARVAEIGDSMRAFNKANGHAVGHKAAPSLSSIPPDKLERLAEIQLAALTVRVGQGDRAAAAERSKLQHALKMKATAGTPLVQALVQMGVNTAAIVRGA